MTTITIPTEPEQISASWLTTVLQTGGHISDATVTGVTFQPVGQGVGILCRLFRLTLTLSLIHI